MRAGGDFFDGTAQLTRRYWYRTKSLQLNRTEALDHDCHRVSDEPAWASVPS
jgi:hypothetical protein